MNSEEKRELAETVVDMTVMNRFRIFSSNSDGYDAKMSEIARFRMREEQTALYAKHYQSKQLTALLDFYSSEMGKSILTSQERVADEMASGVKLVST
ncbi:MAG: hypothetical protein COC19_04495 [SAR86 cluster bacterium]|uniref:DUF2059 domain-containing protein n=1 Tax=SAR86 cluster bacterium TaxID=2030880 RepID=A0A2A4MPC4_9GAMM|nr:MAG: hypothetical protein COC19_04495 [SAR86 cluster bacterium]